MLSLIFLSIFGLQPETTLSFTRFDYHDFDSGGLYTATVTFKKENTEIDLVSVVHIADQAYYQELQHHLDSYDIVFYELVSGGSQQDLSSLSALQTAAGDLLRLSFQLTEINYQASNLLHSDMSWQAIEALLGDNPLPIPPKKDMVEKFIPQFKKQKKSTNDYFKDNPAARRAIKVFLGQLLGDLDHVLEQLNIEKMKGEDILITARNRQAMRVLKPYLSKPGRFALFWGAAHMPDFAHHLKQLGFKPIKTRWHLAWQIGDMKKISWF